MPPAMVATSVTSIVHDRRDDGDVCRRQILSHLGVRQDANETRRSLHTADFGAAPQFPFEIAATGDHEHQVRPEIDQFGRGVHQMFEALLSDESAGREQDRLVAGDAEESAPFGACGWTRPEALSVDPVRDRLAPVGRGAERDRAIQQIIAAGGDPIGATQGRSRRQLGR